jgi:hypothetical protein
MPRQCTVCSHPNRAKIDEALVSGTAIRDIAGQHELTKSAVDRHRTHIGTALVQAAQRKAELEDNLGDDLLGQANALNRDLRRALEDAKQAKSLSAFFQVADRIQKQLALQSTLLERAAGASEANARYALHWLDCPHHPDGCPPDA